MGRKYLQDCLLTLSLIVVYALAGVSGYGSGAPFSTCLTRYPKHSHIMTQTMDNPFTITAEPATYTAGQMIRLTITSSSQKTFMGFQIAGFRREDNPLEVEGQFTRFPVEKAKVFTCSGRYTNNMATHKNNEPVSIVTLEWTSPVNAGDITFRATIVENYESFWTGMELDVDSVDTAAVVEPIIEGVVTSAIVAETNLDGCGDTKACFLYPRHCDNNDCIAAVSFEYQSDTEAYLVEMYADSSSNPGYVGIGFSSDTKMGQDETFICAGDTNELSVQYGLNPAYYNERVITRFISDAEVRREDGHIQCRFLMEPNSTFSAVDHQATAEGDSITPVYTSTSFDKAQAWYIQLAWGEIMAESNVATIHKEMPAVTSSKVYIADVGTYRGSAFHTLVQAHVAVMIVAWTFLTGIVTVISRHYKDMLPTKRLLGTKIWFQLHRALAIIVTLLTIVGFILIFVHYGSTIRDEAKPHAYWGIAVMVAVGLQVIGGMLRPGPDHKLRVVFNWAHFILGQASHILAVVTMFLGFDMDYMTEDMKNFGFITLGVWLAVQILWHILFEIVSCLSKRNTADSYQIQGGRDDQFTLSKDGSGKGSILPSVLMVIYVLFLAACCAAVMCAFLLY